MPRQSAKIVVDEAGVKSYENAIMCMDVRCTCIAKKYQKWLAEFRRFYNMLKAQSIADALAKTEAEVGEIDE